MLGEFMSYFNKTKRKGQEEIVGFVLIVVLVVIILIVFLGIQLRKPPTEQSESDLIYYFLESSMEQTTNCTLSEGASYLALDELIRECHETGSSCFGGATSCDIAKDTFTKLVNGSFAIGPDFPYRGYDVSASYNFNSEAQPQTESVLNITSGNCSNTYTGSSYLIPEPPGSINVRVKLCA